ncbi:MAG TPA: hypothetical protein PLB89_04760 [Flavobacteriales bacterium]|nr:hypothetical protein [Flavobacteriales bacterium]
MSATLKPALPPKAMANKRELLREVERLKRREELNGLLAKQFRPSRSEDDVAEHMMSTDELFHIVQSHSPGLIPARELRTMLLELGYKEKYLSDRFVWLLASAA